LLELETVDNPCLPGPHPAQVLVVEDNPHDSFLLMHAFRELDMPCECHAMTDGLEALEYLDRLECSADRTCPALLIVDLHLLKLSDYELLSAIRQRIHFEDIPVVVWTGLSSPMDIELAYAYGAGLCVTKPAGLDEWMDLARLLRLILKECRPVLAD